MVMLIQGSYYVMIVVLLHRFRSHVDFVVIYIKKPWILQTSRFCSINDYEIYGCILLGIV